MLLLRAVVCSFPLIEEFHCVNVSILLLTDSGVVGSFELL